MSISIEEAIACVLEQTSPLPEVLLPLKDALGLVISRPVNAPIAQPPFDRSPLDGYALRAADVADASAVLPAVLQVIDKIYAGQVSHVHVQPGQAVRLMTGAMLPQGADCVIRQESTDFGESQVRVYASARPGENCCWKGEEYDVGAQLLCAGSKVDAAVIAVAAGAGIAQLPVFRKARVAVISTGDEICQPGTLLSPGKIYDSNQAYLSARLAQLGVEITRTVSAGDRLADIVRTLDLCGDCDVILTTGGVSVGQKDLLESALLEWGAQILFHGIAMKPGMPTLFARRGDCLVLGLSGNPFSAAIPFELLFRPMLAKMTGDSSLEMSWQQAIASTPFPKSSPTRRYLRAVLQGETVAIPSSQSNGQMRSMIGCNCLIDLPAGSKSVNPGDRVNVLLL